MNYTIPSNVIKVRYYNYKDLNGKFMNCQIMADKGTEFISLPFKFADGTEAECLVANDVRYKGVVDLSNGNPLYGVCLVCSESFFKYFVPAFQFLGSKDLDDWKLRYEYIKFILDLFNDSKTKEKIVDYLDSSDNKVINSLLITMNDGYVILNRANLYFSTISILKTIVEDMKRMV